MATVDQIVTLNRMQAMSETDSFTEHRYRQFVRHFFPNTQDVLDVGCNTGRGGTAMKALVSSLRLTGIDCVPERLAALDTAIYEGRICALANEMPVATGRYDAVVAGEFIEHLPPDQVQATLCEFFRVLRLKGLLLLTTPNPLYLKNRLTGKSVLGGPHMSQHYAAALRRRLRDVGFSAIKIRGSGRISLVVGECFPFFAAYGSYLVKARKW